MTILQKGNKGAAKLTPAQVTEIRRLYGEGYTQSSISRHFRVAIGTIGRIVRGESWVEGAGEREATPLELEQMARRAFALQEQLLREKAFEAEHASPPVAPPVTVVLSPEMQALRDRYLREAPHSPLDGGDAPAETAGEGLARLEEVAVEEGLDVEVALKRSVP